MRCTSLAIAITCISLAACEALTLAPEQASPPPQKAPAAQAPAQKPVEAEPVVSPESQKLYEQALAALRAGRYPEAERALLAVAKREPRLAGPQANLGILYGRTGRPAQALEAAGVEPTPDG